MPTSDRDPVVVVDTMLASAWLGRTVSARRSRWADTVERCGWVLLFVVVAEMRFGTRVANWGTRWTAVLERLVANTVVSPPLPELIDAYVDLRTWCVNNGHNPADTVFGGSCSEP